MITDEQVRLLMKYRQTTNTLEQAAAKAHMSETSARKYLQAEKLPSQMKPEHTWRTRPDPFEEVWDQVQKMLEANPGLEAKTIFEELQRQYPGKYQEGQLRTLQRHIKVWRALEGAEKEVFFPQKHHPGELCQSDFTHLTELGITIQKELFPHLLYHFVLTYSNWETGTVCFSENFESVSAGLQNALWELGGVPQYHQTDRLSSAVQKVAEEKDKPWTPRYGSLLRHYGLAGKAIQAGKANENGDIEQRHHRFKRALEQALLLRGSRDFESRKEYDVFLRNLFRQLNAGRTVRLQEELSRLRSLPKNRLDDCKRIQLKVGSSSTIHVLHNTYSVSGRLIGERIEIRAYAQHLEVWYAQRCVDQFPRLRGEGKSQIQYRHLIGWLVRKPGAFVNYRYRADLFPSSQFRIAYDVLQEQMPKRADKEYLHLLELAALEGETRVEQALRFLLQQEEPVRADTVKHMLPEEEKTIPATIQITIPSVDLSVYDHLMREEVAGWLH